MVAIHGIREPDVTGDHETEPENAETNSQQWPRCFLNNGHY